MTHNQFLSRDSMIRNVEALRNAVPNVVRDGDIVDQSIVLNARRDPVEISGTVTASDQAFPCTADRTVRARPIVRHSSGLSRSLLNQAVYDRKWDWVLSVDDAPRIETGSALPAERQGEMVKTGFRPGASRDIVWRARFIRPD